MTKNPAYAAEFAYICRNLDWDAREASDNGTASPEQLAFEAQLAAAAALYEKANDLAEDWMRLSGKSSWSIRGLEFGSGGITINYTDGCGDWCTEDLPSSLLWHPEAQAALERAKQGKTQADADAAVEKMRAIAAQRRELYEELKKEFG